MFKLLYLSLAVSVTMLVKQMPSRVRETQNESFDHGDQHLQITL